MVPLRWGKADDVNLIGRDFDLVLASDVVYHDPLHLYFILFYFIKIFLIFF